MAIRVSQGYVEVLNSGSTPNARVSQAYTEVLTASGTSKARVSQMYVEALHTIPNEQVFFDYLLDSAAYSGVPVSFRESPSSFTIPGFDSSWIKIRFQAPTTGGYKICGCSAGQWLSSYAFVTDARTKITFNGGDDYVEVDSGAGDVWSDWVEMSSYFYMGRLLIHFDTDYTTANPATFVVPRDTSYEYPTSGTKYKTGADNNHDAVDDITALSYASSSYFYAVNSVLFARENPDAEDLSGLSISVVDWAFIFERGEFVTWDFVKVSENVSVDITTGVAALSVDIYDEVGVDEAVELTLSDAQVNVYDEVSVGEDVTVEVASEPTVVISVFDEATGDESVECEVPDLFGSVYDEVSIDDVPEGKASDPQISVNDEVAVAEEVTSRIPVSIEVSDTVTAVEDQASALSVEVWEDDPTTVEETISSFRNILAAGDIRDPGLGVKEIRIKLKAPAQNGYLVTGASIGVRDPGTEDYLPGTVTRITFDGGSVSAAVQSKDLWSDWVVFTAFDHTVDLMIHLDTALLDTVNWNQYSSNGDSYVKNGEFNDCMVEDISGYSFVNYSYNLKSLDVRASMVEGYDVNVYDNDSPSEAVSAVTSGLNISIYDETSVAESVDAIITTALSLSVYDEITVEETVEGIVSAVILSTEDSITVGEDVAGVISLPGISVYEEVTVEEAVSGDISAITISTEDSVTVSEDIVSVTSLGGINTYDEISVVDIPTVSSGEVTISVYDEVSTDDVAEGQYDLPLSVTDSITVTDVPSLLFIASGVFSVVDSVSVVDAVTVELGDLTVSIYDEVTVTETVDLDIAVDSSVYDEVSVTDVPDVVLAELIVDVSDSVSVIEIEFSVAPELIIDVYSSGSVGDSAEGAAGDLVFSVFDAVSIADVDTVDVRLPGPIDVPVVSDTVSVADAVSATVSDLRVNVYDAVRITEYVEIYWEYSVGLIQLDCEGLVINISTEGQGLDVSCVGEYLDIASEGETLSFSCEGQDLTIETEVI